MVAHSRKTPSLSPVRSIRPKAIKPRAINPKAVSPGLQDLQFRPLNLPVPIDVLEDDMGNPTFITLPPSRSSRPVRSRQPTQEGRRLAIAAIDDLWQVDDEWWREHPISRRYYQITAQDDRRLTVFRDQINAQWY